MNGWEPWRLAKPPLESTEEGSDVQGGGDKEDPLEGKETSLGEGEEQVIRLAKTCRTCGKEFHKRPKEARYQWEKRLSCSHECHFESFAKNRDSKECEECGMTFYQPARMASKQFSGQRFCGRRCAGQSARRDGSRGRKKMTTRERILSSSMPEPMSGCWLWLAREKKGYGVMKHEGRVKQAHRVSYEEFVGPIGEGLCVDHLCATGLCINPDHLEAVTWAENMRRGRHGHSHATSRETKQDRRWREIIARLEEMDKRLKTLEGG